MEEKSYLYYKDKILKVLKVKKILSMSELSREINISLSQTSHYIDIYERDKLLITEKVGGKRLIRLYNKKYQKK